MKAEVASLMEKAKRSLAAAKLLLEESDADFAASRAYYAMFYAAEALLLDRGLVFSKHSAVISEFGKLFVKAGLFRAERHADLRMAFDERNIGDYGHGPFPKSAAEEILGLENLDPNSAHSRYNTLIRRLLSFERAAEWAANSRN